MNRKPQIFRSSRRFGKNYARVTFDLRRELLAKLLNVLARDFERTPVDHQYDFEIRFGTFLEIATEDRIDEMHARHRREDARFRALAWEWFRGPRDHHDSAAPAAATGQARAMDLRRG